MSDSERSTKVKVEPEIKFGEFANAFRVVEEIGEDCFLDFMVYSAQEEEAVVVARVRIRRDFLSAICERLGEAMTKFDGLEPPETPKNGVFRKTGETVH
jgi:hypothetical protein